MYLHHRGTLCGGIAVQLEIGEVDVVRLAECLAGLVAGLVERLVGDVRVVSDHRHAIIALGERAGRQGQNPSRAAG